MKRFVEGTDRGQTTLFPECLADWIDENNPVQVIDVFVDGLDLAELGFDGVAPEATGRPSYHPAVLLKLYIYGYLNRVQSSRRLEREAGRNVEVMWLTSRLVPDHKTIADFRKDSGPAIKQVCVQFVELCRLMGLLTKASVAIDGSKFKAVNTRDKNFTRGKVVDTKHHLIVTHEVTNDGSDRAQLASIACQAKQVLGIDELEAVADRGYYSGAEILACHEAGIEVTLPKPMASGIEARGRFGKQDFRYVTEEDVYVCPAGEKLAYHYTNEENGLVLRRYWTNACQSCAIKQRCTTGKERRITRWEHEHVLDEVQKRLDKNPQAIASASRDGRTSLRHAEDEDGGDALPDEASAQGRHRDGTARTRLQSHPRHEHHGHSAADGRHPGIVKSRTTAGFTSSCSSNILRQNVSTRPRRHIVSKFANVVTIEVVGKVL